MKPINTDKFKRTKEEKKEIFQYSVCSIVIGVGCGVISSLFNMLQVWIQSVRTTAYHNHIFLGLMPVIGVIMLLGMKLIRQEKHGGTAVGIKALQDERIVLKPSFALGALLSLSLTNLSESAMVREAGVFQMNIPFAHFLCEKVYKKVDKSVAAACAVAAGFAAMWGLPLFGVLFASEMAHGAIRKKALIWSFVSAVFAYPMQKFIYPTSSALFFPELPKITALSLLGILALAVGIGLFARLMCWSFYELGKIVRIIKNPYFRIAAGGIFGAAVCFIFGHNEFLCGYGSLMASALKGELINDSSIYYAFLAKYIVFTVLKKAGYKTGKLAQTWCIGALLGELIGSVAFGLEPGIGAMLGLLCLFAATYNTTAATVVLIIELFPGILNTIMGERYFIIMIVAIIISRIVSGNCTLYHTQKLNVTAKEEWNR